MNCVRWLFSRHLEDRLPFLSGPDTDTDALSDEDHLDIYDVSHNGARTINIRDSIHTLARPLAEREQQARSERLVATLPSISPYIIDDKADEEEDDEEKVCAICLDLLFVRSPQCDSDSDHSEEEDDCDDDCEGYYRKEFTKCHAHAHVKTISSSSRRGAGRRKEETNMNSTCSSSSQPQTVTKTQCNHVMHRKCLATWLASDPSLSCPVCRVPVQPAKISPSSYSYSPSSSSSLLAKKKSKLLFAASSDYAAAPVSNGVRRSRRMAMLDEQEKHAHLHQQHGLETHPSTSSSASSSGAVVRSPTPVPHFYHHHHQYQYQNRIAATAGVGGGADRRRRAS